MIDALHAHTMGVENDLRRLQRWNNMNLFIQVCFRFVWAYYASTEMCLCYAERCGMSGDGVQITSFQHMYFKTRKRWCFREYSKPQHKALTLESTIGSILATLAISVSCFRLSKLVFVRIHWHVPKRSFVFSARFNIGLMSSWCMHEVMIVCLSKLLNVFRGDVWSIRYQVDLRMACNTFIKRTCTIICSSLLSVRTPTVPWFHVISSVWQCCMLPTTIACILQLCQIESRDYECEVGGCSKRFKTRRNKLAHEARHGGTQAVSYMSAYPVCFCPESNRPRLLTRKWGRANLSDTQRSWIHGVFWVYFWTYRCAKCSFISGALARASLFLTYTLVIGFYMRH